MSDFNQVAENLRDKTRAELREICAKRGIECTTKTLHEDLVQSIVESIKEEEEAAAEAASTYENDDPIVAMTSTVSSFVVNDEIKSYISISCGASQGNFLVVGKSVSEVAEFLSEVLNIDKLSEPVVNGDPVGPMYILKSGDSLEFVKLAGKKG